MYVIQLQWLADGRHSPIAGKYLLRADFEAFGGRGVFAGTGDISKAMRFRDLGEAHDFWMTQSKTAPLRDDGEPNRPMTSYTVTMVEVVYV